MTAVQQTQIEMESFPDGKFDLQRQYIQDFIQRSSFAVIE